jgi:hypothetical protein
MKQHLIASVFDPSMGDVNRLLKVGEDNNPHYTNILNCAQKNSPMVRLVEMAEKRNHKITGIGNPTGITKGKITFHCFKCKQEHTTTYKSYSGAKNGCPRCKGKRTSGQGGDVPRKTDAEKALTAKLRRERYKKAAEEHPIKNRQMLIEYLEKENNSYSILMLEILTRKKPEGFLEGHHIIPCHDNGPRASFNQVKLTPEEHLLAHQLRYEAYGQEYDLKATYFPRQSTAEYQEMVKNRNAASNKTCRQKGIGLYDPKNCSAGGKKGGAVVTPTKIDKYVEKQNVTVTDYLKKGSTWLHRSSGQTLVVGPGQAKLVNDFYKIFLDFLGSGSEFEHVKTLNKYNVASNVSKVFKGIRNVVQGFELIKS